MGELVGFSEQREKILSHQTLLFAEPVFQLPGEDEGKKTKFFLPVGAEDWVPRDSSNLPSGQIVANNLFNEYCAIASALKEMHIPFRIIVAHRRALDEALTLAICNRFGVRGLLLHETISSTCFPRDMMMDFDGETYINPDANFAFPDHSGLISPLGEGGKVLKLGRKVLVSDPRGFFKTRDAYVTYLRRLSNRFQLGFLPHPQALEMDIRKNKRSVFLSNHLDRAAAFLKGKDERDYLLLDKHYVDESHPSVGSYRAQIQETCQNLDIIPVVVDRTRESIPYALNLEQFADKSVLLTGGDAPLAQMVREIVGADKVHVTDRPIMFYPLYRNGGIRCMLLHAPKKIVGNPVVSPM